MTFDDDMAFLEFDGGTMRVPLKNLGLSWPPPEAIEVLGFKMRRERWSTLTDEQRATMTHVCRCVEYFPEKIVEPA